MFIKLIILIVNLLFIYIKVFYLEKKIAAVVYNNIYIFFKRIANAFDI